MLCFESSDSPSLRYCKVCTSNTACACLLSSLVITCSPQLTDKLKESILSMLVGVTAPLAQPRERVCVSYIDIKVHPRRERAISTLSATFSPVLWSRHSTTCPKEPEPSILSTCNTRHFPGFRLNSHISQGSLTLTLTLTLP